jgi:chromosome segregation ATPase
MPKPYTQSEITEAKERLSSLVAVYEESVRTKRLIAPITSFKKLTNDVKAVLGALDTADEEGKALDEYVADLVQREAQANARAEKAESRIKELEAELSTPIMVSVCRLVEAKADAERTVKVLKARVEELEAEQR